jgi:hypothetical protein
MTVQELMEKLKEFPPDAEVLGCYDGLLVRDMEVDRCIRIRGRRSNFYG